jgi:RHS repeat-associated protein
VTHLTDADGTIIEKYRYDVFGAPTFYNGGGGQISTTAYNNRFLFTGREYLGAWVYDYRARLYHAYLGRFMGEDPKLFDAGDYNLFRYCHNDPIDMTDPMGLATEVVGIHDPREESRRKADEEYNGTMAAAQMNSSGGAIAVAALAATTTAQLHGSVINYSEAAGLQTGAIPRGSNSISDKPQALVLNGQPVWDRYAQKWVLVPPHVSLDKNMAQAKQVWPTEWVPKVWRNGEWDYKRQGPFRDFGNVNYGVTGRAVGYDALTLRGGGWIYKLTHGTAFPLRETYRDQHMIQVGIDYYESQAH